jgi:hypothetical protein
MRRIAPESGVPEQFPRSLACLVKPTPKAGTSAVIRTVAKLVFALCCPGGRQHTRGRATGEAKLTPRGAQWQIRFYGEVDKFVLW